MHMSKTSVAWKIYRTRFLVKARQLEEPLSFEDALGRQQSGRPGDYLIESSDGSRSIQRREMGVLRRFAEMAGLTIRGEFEIESEFALLLTR